MTTVTEGTMYRTSREPGSEGVGVPRPSEPFHRVYSAPEPPAQARRPKLLALLLALISFAVAGVAVFLLVPGKDGGTRTVSESPTAGGTAGGAGPGSTPGGEPSSVAPSSPSASPSQTPSASGTPAQVIGTLPKPCATVSKRTVQRVVPKARREESANSTLSTCTYSSAGSGFRWLRVEAHLYAPDDTASPVQNAARYYAAEWAQAHDAPLVRTLTLEPQPGIGDEAYRWFKVDKGQPTVVGQVTTRARNIVVTVSYSEQSPGGGAEAQRENACLANAAGVTREVLANLR